MSKHLDSEEVFLLQCIASAASDYKQASSNKEFSAQFGGLKRFRDDLFSVVSWWEKHLDERGK